MRQQRKYDASRPLHLRTVASGVSLGAVLLQAKHGKNSGCDEVPENATLHPTAFASKYQSSAE